MFSLIELDKPYKNFYLGIYYKNFMDWLTGKENTTKYNYSGLKYIIIISFIVLAVYLLVKHYLNLIHLRKSKPILQLTPNNGKRPSKYLSSKIPPSVNNGYSISLWMWIDDWDYKYGEWKHVLHRGDEDKYSVQPGVWLHPTLNKLVVKFDRKNREPDYEYKDRHVFNSLNVQKSKKMPKKVFFSPLLENSIKKMGDINKIPDGTLDFGNNNIGDIQKWCSSESDCQGFTVADLNEGNITDLSNPVFVGAIPSEKNDLLIKNEDPANNVITFGTFVRNKDKTTMDPSINKSIISDSTVKNEVDNIVLGRWTHLCIVVSSNMTQIYIDGRVRSSTVLETEISRNNGDLWLTQDGGFSGITTRLQYFNEAITNKTVNKLYVSGPNSWIMPDYTKYFKKSYWLNKENEEKD